MESLDIDNIIKPLLLKDLRIQCRQRGVSPAGSREELAQRLKAHMIETNDFFLRTEDGSVMSGPTVAQLFGQSSTNTGNNYQRSSGQNVGNFLGDRPSSRVLAAPGGNSTLSLGNVSVPPPRAPHYHAPNDVASPPPRMAPINTQPSPVAQKQSSVLDSLAAKIAGNVGGGHTYAPKANYPYAAAAPPAPENRPPQADQGSHFGSSAAPTGGNNYHRPSGQNVGNFLTDKPSSRVLAPPGGVSSITFG